jgi:endoglycosylceramidase
MHQDLFSVLYSDGAPAWATLHEERPHKQGAVWSDSYLISPAVQVSFDNFWANTPASDGIGIQDHYAAAWRHIAERFTDNSTVIGYDIMNEPFEGTSVIAGHAAILRSEFATLLMERLGDKVQSPDEIMTRWLDPAGRNAITVLLEDIDMYRAFVDAQIAHSQTFERNYLQPMYQRVANAIRSVDPYHLLLLETSYHCNSGVYSRIEPVTGADGKRDPQQAYVPHGYDIVVDTAALANANRERVELIFRRHSQTAKRLAMPMIIGEWGAFGDADERILPSARILQQQFETHLCGDTYWDYGRDIERKAYFETLKRSIPSRIAGTLLEYGSDPQTGAFTCRWKEMGSIAAPTIIYLTEATFQDRVARLKPEGAGFVVQPVSNGTGDVYISISPSGESVERVLTLN